jgi:hypothetical protein
MINRIRILNCFMILSFLMTFKLSQAQTKSVLKDSNYQMYVHTLKTGSLFVELSDRSSIRAKLVEHDEQDKLRRFDFELNKEFSEIFKAFDKYYKFGKVYFYYKSEAHLLRQKKYSKMQWFNTSRNSISSIDIDTMNYLLGSFGKMERLDSISIYDDNGKLIRKEPKTSFYGFVFRDAEHKIINKNYFLHVRSIFRTRTKVIRLLNAQLTNNYNTILSFNKTNNP